MHLGKFWIGNDNQIEMWKLSQQQFKLWRKEKELELPEVSLKKQQYNMIVVVVIIINNIIDVNITIIIKCPSV